MAFEKETLAEDAVAMGFSHAGYAKIETLKTMEEVRNMCAAAGLHVDRLMRIRQGALFLGRLPAGKWRVLTAEEIRWLQSLQ